MSIPASERFSENLVYVLLRQQLRELHIEVKLPKKQEKPAQ